MNSQEQSEMGAALDNWRSAVQAEKLHGRGTVPINFVEAVLGAGDYLFDQCVQAQRQREELEPAYREAVGKLDTWGEHNRFLLDRLAESNERRDALIAALRQFAHCPHCEGVEACEPGCAFVANSAEYRFTITSAREALNV